MKLFNLDEPVEKYSREAAKAYLRLYQNDTTLKEIDNRLCKLNEVSMPIIIYDLKTGEMTNILSDVEETYRSHLRMYRGLYVRHYHPQVQQMMDDIENYIWRPDRNRSTWTTSSQEDGDSYRGNSTERIQNRER